MCLSTLYSKAEAEVGMSLTNVSEVRGRNPFDLVEASVEISGFLGQGRHGLDVDLLAVHGAAQAHAQQTRGQVCQQGTAHLLNPLQPGYSKYSFL